MAKYQFFCKPDSNRKAFTYIEMASNSFSAEKQQLLEVGFEVEGDVIYADSSDEAVDKFKSNFVAPLEDYANSHPAGGIATFMFETFKAIRGKK
ncbi:hypothetical protein [Photobacterium lutimaris]|uniref:Uncharacterized protein n=1 Tax=Photobacterium lutimaris TaxID=388278 RepID=A0A2T3IYL7_9GAMM|nr:hypothetical protein [Photobacterium lutimaris]PSU33685.1 hypothetical protein C9I99_13025 [Photobacterium lutimaris]TDR74460.1 hypothetical protein DFP78_10747 [Photobacterium lutimaris]